MESVYPRNSTRHFQPFHFTASNDLRKQYLFHRLEEIVSCRSNLVKDNWAPILRAAENLNGNAETFGFVRLSQLGHRLERAAEKKNRKRTHALLLQFEKVVSEELAKV